MFSINDHLLLRFHSAIFCQKLELVFIQTRTVFIKTDGAFFEYNTDLNQRRFKLQCGDLVEDRFLSFLPLGLPLSLWVYLKLLFDHHLTSASGGHVSSFWGMLCSSTIVRLSTTSFSRNDCWDKIFSRTSTIVRGLKIDFFAAASAPFDVPEHYSFRLFRMRKT